MGGTEWPSPRASARTHNDSRRVLTSPGRRSRFSLPAPIDASYLSQLTEPDEWVAPILRFWDAGCKKMGGWHLLGMVFFSVFLWGFGGCDLMCHTPREEYIASGNDCRSVYRLTLRTRNTLC